MKIYNSGGDTPLEEHTYYNFRKVIYTGDSNTFHYISSLTSDLSYAIIGKDDSYRERLIKVLSPQMLSK